MFSISWAGDGVIYVLDQRGQLDETLLEDCADGRVVEDVSGQTVDDCEQEQRQL